MKIRYLNIISIGALLASMLSTPVLASDERFVIAAPPVTADELGHMRGGMTIPKVKEIVVVGLRSREAIKSVIPELSGIVVLAAVPEVARGISEALITTAAGVKETIGRIAAGVRTARSAALQQGRILLDSD